MFFWFRPQFDPFQLSQSAIQLRKEQRYLTKQPATLNRNQLDCGTEAIWLNQYFMGKMHFKFFNFQLKLILIIILTK